MPTSYTLPPGTNSLYQPPQTRDLCPVRDDDILFARIVIISLHLLLDNALANTLGEFAIHALVALEEFRSEKRAVLSVL